MDRQCGYCHEFMELEEQHNPVWYEERPHHPSCFKEKAREEMPEKAAEKVAQHVDNGIRKFRIEGTGLRPIEEVTPSSD